MLESPNETDLKDILQNIDNEYDLETRLSRYQSSSPELIKFAIKEGTSELEAPRALFIADFIISASEVLVGGTDEERYHSVINCFIWGREICSSPDILMRIFYLAYKTASKIRRQDLFMGGRGLSRKAALIRLKDAFITPYLKVVSEKLDSKRSGCGWELGVLSAALKRNYPDIEIKNFENAPSHLDQKLLTTYIWRLLESYSAIQKVETNPNTVIPNINESKSILLLDSKKISLVSMWNFNDPSKVLNAKKEIQYLTEFLNKQILNHKILSIKGYISKKNRYVFFVIDPFIPSRPLYILETPADEINLSKVLSILRLRGLEQDGWKNVFPDKIKTIVSEKVTNDEEKQEIKQNIEEELDQKNLSFFSKIKRKLFGKRKPDISEKRTIPKPRIYTKKIKIDKLDRKVPSYVLNTSFLSQAITIDAVSDLDIYELWDTVREADYHITGIFDSIKIKNKTIYSIKQGSTLHNTIDSFLVELYKIILKLSEILFSIRENILLEEIFFISEDQNKQLLVLSGDQEGHIVGTIATSFDEQIADWQSRRKEKEPLQRRSLHRRTKQFLTTRRHTKFNDAVERIYGQNFDLDLSEIKKIDKTFFFDN